MKDRELLELAAKACGELMPSWYGNSDYMDGVLSRWNPLTDDGDALRLAAKLRLEIYYGDDEGEAVFVKVCRENGRPWYVCEFLEADPYAATRLAIVRAAAEIGKAMP